MRCYNVCVVMFGIALSGCPASDAEWQVRSNDDAAPRPVTWEQFRASAELEPWADGAFIVDGDIRLFGEAALRSFYDTRVAPQSGALTVRRVLGADVLWSTAQRFQLTYCISNGFGARKAAIVTAMQQAAASWSDVVAVGFDYRAAEDASCTISNNNVLFDVRPVTASYFASAFFPDSPRAERELLVTDAAFTTTQGGRDLQGILRHELGHVLGFRHEHVHITCTGESTTESRQVTSYDVNSVMHYPQCRPNGAGGYRQTALDFQGAISLYGAAQGAWSQLHGAHDMRHVATGDLDGNGVDDLIVDFVGWGLGVFFNNSFWVQVHGPHDIRHVATGDLDGNGMDDLIVDFVGWGLGVYFNNSFWVQAHGPHDIRHVVATGDLDGNGMDDLIVDFVGWGLGVLFNNSFWVQAHGPHDIRHVATGDLDGNGVDDLIVDFVGWGLGVLFNNSFWVQAHGPHDMRHVATGDLDGNGTDDLVVDFVGWGLGVLFNNSAWMQVHGPHDMRHVTTGDLDGNGADDLIVDFVGWGLGARY